jgi:hypothetical protein
MIADIETSYADICVATKLSMEVRQQNCDRNVRPKLVVLQARIISDE